MKKRLWTIVFAIAMALSLVTVTALAADEGIAGDGETYVAQIGDQKYGTLAAAVEAVPTNGEKTTIVLTGNIVMSTDDIVTIGAGQNVVLNMYGKKITVGENFEGRPIVNEGILTITGEGTIDSTKAETKGKGSVSNSGTLTIESGTFLGSTENESANIWNAGTAVFNGGTYDTGATAIGTGDGSTTTINGGTYISARYPAIENRGKMTITGGKFENFSCSSCITDGRWGYTIRSGYGAANAYLEIRGTAEDSVQVTGVQGGLSVVSGSADIYKGVYTTVACEKHSDGSTSYHPLYVAGEDGKVVCTVHGGTYTAAYREAIRVGNSGDDGKKKENAVLQIYGGSFTSGKGVDEAVNVDEKVGELRVEGGDFSSDVSEYVPDDYAQGADGVVGPLGAENATAQVGADYFKTLAAAIEAAGDGQTVKLLRNAASDVIDIDKNLTIDLAGFTWTGTDENYVFTVLDNYTVTIKGGIIAEGPNYLGLISAGDVTLENCTVTTKDNLFCHGGTVLLKNTDLTATGSSAYGISLQDGTVTLDKDSSITAMGEGRAIGVFVKGTDEKSDPVLNVYGKINTYGATIQGNGSDRSYPVINIYPGAVLTAVKTAMYLPQPGTVTIDGATVTGYAAIGMKSGTLNIHDSTIHGTANDDDLAKYPDDQFSDTNGIACDGSAIVIDSYIGYAGEVNINITGNSLIQSDYSTAIREIGNDAGETNVVSLNIESGEIRAAEGKDAVKVREATTDTVSISGGTFSSAVPVEYCAPGFEPATVDGKYTVQLDPKEDFVAQVKNEAGQITGAYETLADALTDAKSGDTIVLLANADLNADVVISGNITIDGQGKYTIETKPVSHAITVSANAALTLNHVTLKITGESGYGIDVRYDGALTLNHSTLDISGVSNATISAETDGASNSEPGKFTLTNGSTIIASNIGGNFSNGGTWSLEDGSKIDINGCTSHGLSCDSVTVDRSTVEISGTGLLGLTAREVELVNGGQVTVENCGKELPKDSQWSTDKDGYKYPVEIKQGGTVTVDETSSFELTNNTNGNDTIYLVEATLDNDGVVKAEVVTKAPAGSVAIIVIDRGNTLSSETITTGQYTLPAAPTRPGYVFDGWQSDDGTIYDAGDSVKIEKNTTFTAQWSVYVAPNPSYLVSVNQAQGGKVTANPTAAKKGDTVTLTVTPEEGYELAELTVTDFWGKDVAFTDNGDGTYTFTMPGSQVEIEASFTQTGEPEPELPFTDVTEADWFYDEVQYVVDNGLMIGTSDTTFDPNGTTTRAQVVTILYRLEGEPDLSGENLGYPYEDVPADTWYTDAVYWARLNGIVLGYSDTQFAPDDPITREQLAAMLYRYAQYKGYDVTATGDLSGFADADTVSDWAEEAMRWSVGAGLIQGDENGLTPTATAIRAQIAAILMRFCENVAK